jgi:hypothetical protein
MTTTDNPKIGSSTAVATTVLIMPTDHGAWRAGGIPIQPLGRRIHHDTMPVALSHISETANSVFSHRLTGPKSP